MTTEAVTAIWPDSTCLSRLYALVSRGYRPVFRRQRETANYVGIDLIHPRRTGHDVPPPVTLWSDGSLATSKVLWPQKYVANEAGPPDWQRYILPAEKDRFSSFLDSVRLPTIWDLYVMPSYREGKVFAARFIFGASLCVLLGSAIKLAEYFA